MRRQGVDTIGQQKPASQAVQGNGTLMEETVPLKLAERHGHRPVAPREAALTRSIVAFNSVDRGRTSRVYAGSQQP